MEYPKPTLTRMQRIKQTMKNTTLLHDGESLPSHDIIIVLYNLDNKLTTTHIYNNDLTQRGVMNHLHLKHPDQFIQLLKVWK